MLDLAIPLVTVALLIAIVDWRKGPLLMIVTLILQDPIRKLSPAQPVVLVIFAAGVFGIACLGAWLQRVPLSPLKIYGWQRYLGTPFNIFILLLFFQAFHSYSNFGSAMMPLFGMVTYFIPVIGMAFAYELVVDGGQDRIKQFIKVYVACTFVALTTVALQATGYDWVVLGEVGEGLMIYDRVLGSIKANSGIYRASEIAAWHAATCACFFFILLTTRKISLPRIALSAVAIIALLLIGSLTGRRKMVVEVVIFFISYFALWAVFQRAAARLAMALAIVGVLGFTVLVAESEVDTHERVERSFGYDSYVRRAESVFADIPTRFVDLGVAPLMGTFEQFGVFGAGIGVAAQGGQYFISQEVLNSPGFWLVSGAAEGGLGKIMVEFGFFGFIIVGWLGVAATRHFWWIMRTATNQSPELGRLSYGLVSFLISNVAAFSVATQAFGDPSILLFLSLTVGFLFAIPVLSERAVRKAQSLEPLKAILQPITVQARSQP